MMSYIIQQSWKHFGKMANDATNTIRAIVSNITKGIQLCGRVRLSSKVLDTLIKQTYKIKKMHQM